MSGGDQRPGAELAEARLVRFEVDDEGDGQRLDRVLADHLDWARNRAQGLIRAGLVEVDGAVARPSLSLSPGQIVECRVVPPDPSGELVPEALPVPILTLGPDHLMIDKPAGLVVHPGAGHRQGTLVHRLLHHFPEIAGVGSIERPGIVHRLDAGTSGVMAIARSQQGYEVLSRAFSQRQVKKVYLAIVYGAMAQDAGTIDLPLARHARHRVRMAVRKDGRPATTRWQVLAMHEGVSLLGIDLLTGRTHQIRAHLKHIGHPLVGDPLYGEDRWRGLPKRLRGPLKHAIRPALHSLFLEVPDPTGEGRSSARSLPPDDLRNLWQGVTGGGQLGELAEELLDSLPKSLA